MLKHLGRRYYVSFPSTAQHRRRAPQQFCEDLYKFILFPKSGDQTSHHLPLHRLTPSRSHNHAVQNRQWIL